MIVLQPRHLRALLDLWPLIESRRAYAERRIDVVWRLATHPPNAAHWPVIGDWRDQMAPPEEWARAVERDWSIRLPAPEGWTGDIPTPDDLIARVRLGVGDAARWRR